MSTSPWFPSRVPLGECHTLSLLLLSLSQLLCLGMDIAALLPTAFHTVLHAAEADVAFGKASTETQLDALNPLPFRGEAEHHCHHFPL